MIVTEHGREDIRGLPGPVPKGERIVWQGCPDWRSLAVHAFHVRAVSLYLGVMLAWLAASTYHDTGSLVTVLQALAIPVPLSIVCVALLCGLAWLSARNAVYTVMTRRIVIKFGLALPMTVNLPFKLVEGAGLHVYKDGTGDIPIALGGPDRLAYLHLWPHARPWKLTRPEPMLRSIPEPELVADLLRQAILDLPRLEEADKRLKAGHRTHETKNARNDAQVAA